MSMIIDGTNGLTFNNATTQASAGSVIQVVQVTTNTSSSSSSNSFVTTSHSASITPKFSTSKILVTASSPVSANGSNPSGAVYTIYKNNSTNLASGSGTYGFGHLYENGYAGYISANCTMVYLDSPATTSSTTYTVYQYALSGSSVAWASSGGPENYSTATLTLMEIAS